ncbi:MAG: C39 family peptidase [bacterium]|nr:C39 family peptidase [bacterium]
MKIAKQKFYKIISLVIVMAVFLMPISASALTSAQLKAQQEYYAQQAAAARAQAAAKAQQAAQIKQQLNIVGSQIYQTQSAINLTISQVADTNARIAQIEADIKMQEDNLNAEQSKLSNVVASWYMSGRSSGFFEAIIGSNNFSDIIDQQQYYDSVRGQIQNQMDKITQLKADLNSQKTDQQNQLASLNDLKNDQTAQKSDLAEKKSIQNQLLTDANGAISDLNNQAAQAEAKATEIRKILIQIYSGSGTPQGNGLISSVDNSWYYNQQNYTTPLIGASDFTYSNPLTIALAGCLVTSFAMVATKMGHPITPPSVVNNSHFVYGSWMYFTSGIGVSFNSSTRVNWDTVNSELARNRPVIVSVYTGSGPVYNSDGSNHFIVIKGVSNGKYIIHDPYWTSSSYNLTSVKSMKVLSDW